MHEDFATAPQSQAVDVRSLERRIHQLSVAVAILAGALVVCVAVFAGISWRHAEALTTTKDDIFFGRFIHYDYDSDDYVAPVINAIQFFHDSYSIQFEKVLYTGDGLELSGEMGNPNQFRITDLTLTFAARPYPKKSAISGCAGVKIWLAGRPPGTLEVRSRRFLNWSQAGLPNST
jgi:hypothetical protein